jgi:epoxyqueuosine reductase
VKFSQALVEDSPFAAREFVRGKDAVTLARDILALDQDAFSAAFRKSPMKRAKLRGLQRNAAVVLCNVGTTDDVDVLTRAQQDDEPLVPEHARWALARRR